MPRTDHTKRNTKPEEYSKTQQSKNILHRFNAYCIVPSMPSSETVQKLKPLYEDASFVKSLEAAVKEGGTDVSKINKSVSDLVMKAAKDKGISITQAELDSASLNDINEDELAAISGGISAGGACKVGAGVQGTICGVGAIFTGGASAIASLVTVGGVTAGSAVAGG